MAFESVDLNWQDYVEIDQRYYRPSEVNLLLGDYSKAKDILGWEPQTTFPSTHANHGRIRLSIGRE